MNRISMDIAYPSLASTILVNSVKWILYAFLSHDTTVKPFHYIYVLTIATF